MDNSLKKERRERHLANLIREAIVNVIAEQQQAVPPPPAAMPDQSVPQPMPQDPAQTPQPDQTQQQELSVDSLIERLNVIRGGKSFTDPQVYEAMTNFYNGLTPQDKESLDRNLTEIGKVVISANDQQQQGQQPPTANNPVTTPAPVGGQTPPPPAAGGAPITPVQ